MKTIIDGIEYTDETPTEPGDYRWKPDKDSDAILESVESNWDYSDSGGLWCRLAPAAEVNRLRAEVARLRGEIEKAFREGSGYGYAEEAGEDESFNGSRAKRVMEGKE